MSRFEVKIEKEVNLQGTDISKVARADETQTFTQGDVELINKFLASVFKTYEKNADDTSTVGQLIEAMYFIYSSMKTLKPSPRIRLAQKAGISCRHLERIDKRTTNPTVDTLIRLLEAQGLRVDVRVLDENGKDLLADYRKIVASRAGL